MSLLDDPDFPHTAVQVATCAGNAGRGDTFATSVTRSVIVEAGRKLVRDMNGEQVVSETTLYARLDDTAIFTVGSKITIGDRTSRVITAKPHQLDPDVDHLEIALT